MNELPNYISILFGLTVLLTIGWSYWATKSTAFLVIVLAWAVLQSILGLQGVYQDPEAVPSPFQQISLDQPNVAVLYFPFNLLPTVVVPLVLLAHLVAIRRLMHGV